MLKLLFGTVRQGRSPLAAARSASRQSLEVFGEPGKLRRKIQEIRSGALCRSFQEIGGGFINQFVFAIAHIHLSSVLRSQNRHTPHIGNWAEGLRFVACRSAAKFHP